MKLETRFIAACLGAGVGIAAAIGPAVAQPAEIVVGTDGEYPESITSTRDGTIFIGAMGKGTVYRVAPGSTDVEPFIEGLSLVVGVFAHGGTLWVCDSANIGTTDPSYANSYDIASGELIASYPFPGDTASFCNDFAVGRDGSVYVADTIGARVLVLKPGADALEVFHEDADLLAGVDGLAVIDGELIANSVTTNRLFQIEVDDAYEFGGIFEFTLDQELAGPDGMRALPTDDGVLVVEGGSGRLVIVRFGEGRNGTVEVVAEGFTGATAVTQIGNYAYVLEGKLASLFDPSLEAPDSFSAIPVAIE